MASAQRVYLGIDFNGRSVQVVTSVGQRSSITAEAARAPDDWVELATYGVPLPDPHVLLACVALPAQAPRALKAEIVEAARGAGWDGILLVDSLTAARRGLRGRRQPTPEGGSAPGDLSIVVVAPEATSVGLLHEEQRSPLDQDAIHPAPGREAREVAVSLRCMLKQRPQEQVRSLLRHVYVTGDAQEVGRIGHRAYERELEALGAQRITFDLEPFLVAEGAERIAEETEPTAWRRVRRRRI